MNIVHQPLILREYQHSDAEDLSLSLADLLVVEHLPWGPLRREAVDRFISKAIRNSLEVPRINIHLAICAGNPDVLVGGCGLFIRSLVNREAEICYWLARKHWGRGYATVAAKALVNMGFNDLKLHRIIATCSVENARSVRVLEKIPMRLEGVLKQNVWQRTKWRDSYLYSILDTEWAKLSE